MEYKLLSLDLVDFLDHWGRDGLQHLTAHCDSLTLTSMAHGNAKYAAKMCPHMEVSINGGTTKWMVDNEKYR